jgi:hypothetical protein
MAAMKPSHALAALAWLALAGSACAQAQRPAAASAGSEPKVQQIVVEDEGSRIEELRVRGATQRISVQPKVGTTKGYEILVGDGSRDRSEGVDGRRGAAGKRVWHVLSF